jgi:hypothetical protein
MRKQWRWAVCVSIAIGCFAGCNNQKSPSKVVQAALTAANEGKYSEADQYLSSATMKAMSSPDLAAVGGTKKVWDQITVGGTIVRVETLKEEKRGEGATVTFRVHFKNGATVDPEWNLRMEDGRWKLVWD